MQWQRQDIQVVSDVVAVTLPLAASLVLGKTLGVGLTPVRVFAIVGRRDQPNAYWLMVCFYAWLAAIAWGEFGGYVIRLLGPV